MAGERLSLHLPELPAVKQDRVDDTVSAPSSHGEGRGEGRGVGQANSRQMKSLNAELLARIDAGELPKGYVPAKHQEYVDRRWPELSPEQSARVNQLWKEKQAIDPDMPNRCFSFVKILAYVAEGDTLPAENSKHKKPSTLDPAKLRGDDLPKEDEEINRE